MGYLLPPIIGVASDRLAIVQERMIIEPDLITFPTYKIYPELDIGELEEIIYYDDEVIEYEPEAYFLGNARHCRCNAGCIAKEKNRNCGKSRQN